MDFFLDDILANIEQDIFKHKSSAGAQGPCPGMFQHPSNLMIRKKQSGYSTS